MSSSKTSARVPEYDGGVHTPQMSRAVAAHAHSRNVGSAGPMPSAVDWGHKKRVTAYAVLRGGDGARHGSNVMHAVGQTDGDVLKRD